MQQERGTPGGEVEDAEGRRGRGWEGGMGLLPSGVEQIGQNLDLQQNF